MDMTIAINNRKITTTVYEKPLALHLYIPPHSCHPPGVLTGLVMGMVMRFYQLCSKKEDIDKKLKEFFGHLLDSGHKASMLTPLFDKAMKNAKDYISRTPEHRNLLRAQKEEENKRRVFFHIPFHPQNPSSSTLQSLWRRTVGAPTNKTPLNKCKNHSGNEIPIDRMVIAYSRAPNIGNLLSYRKICNRTGPNVSSFI